MKNLLFVLLLASASFKAPVHYSLDPAKSGVKWTGYAAAGAYSPTGTIKVKSGSVTLDGDRVTAAKVVIDMPTLSHEKAELQTHLRGDDFFAVEKYPESVFVLTSIKDNIANGKVTIKGITQPVTFPLTVEVKNGTTMVKAQLKIDRTLFGIKYNSTSYFQDLGSYAIKNEFNLDLTLYFTAD